MRVKVEKENLLLQRLCGVTMLIISVLYIAKTGDLTPGVIFIPLSISCIFSRKKILDT